MASDQQLQELDTAQTAISTVVRGLIEDNVNFHAITTALLIKLDAIINAHPQQHVRDGVRKLFSEKLSSGNI